jgi:hypothetical protein
MIKSCYGDLGLDSRDFRLAKRGSQSLSRPVSWSCPSPHPSVWCLRFSATSSVGHYHNITHIASTSEFLGIDDFDATSPLIATLTSCPELPSLPSIQHTLYVLRMNEIKRPVFRDRDAEFSSLPAFTTVSHLPCNLRTASALAKVRQRPSTSSV